MIARLLILVAVVASGWYGWSHLASDRADTPAASRAAGGVQPPGAAVGEPVKYIASVRTVDDSRGEIYRVRPARAGRTAGIEELRIAWRQAVRRGVPDRSGLRDQFLCHPLSIIARGKPTWDLESWRPSVGLSRTMLSGCNPA